VHTGQPELAKTELATAFAASGDTAWPAPIADFYLGRLSAAELLKAAGTDPALAKDRSCRSLWAIADWHFAHGDEAALPALTQQRTNLGCPIVGMTMTRPVRQRSPQG